MNEKILKEETRKDITVVWVMFIIGIMVHFCMANFAKTIRIWPDEMRYYTIAKSIFNGQGITFRGAVVDYQKLLYSIIILPFFGIQDGCIRITMISLFNCILEMIAIFPIYGICKELGLHRWQQRMILLLYICWPETMLSMTFMAEILYVPIFFLVLYLWIKWEDSKTIYKGMFWGMLCYAGYNTKEIFLAVILAFIMYEVWEIWRNKDTEVKRTLLYLVSAVGTFVVIHILLKMTVFSGMGNSYRQMSIDALMSKYNMAYMIYAAMYYMAACMVVTLVLPMVLPYVHYKSMSLKNKQLLKMVSLILLISIGTIAYTIAIREDLGQLIPRTHFRYLGPMLFLYFMLFAGERTKQAEKTHNYVLVFIAYICSLLLYKGANCATVVDGQMAWWIHKLQQKMGLMIMPGLDKNSLISFKYVWMIDIVIVLVGLLYLLMKRGHQIYRTYLFMIIFMGLCVWNNWLGYKEIQKEYIVDKECIAEVEQMNQYFDGKHANILYLTDATKGYGRNSAMMDTYFTQFKNVYYSPDRGIFDLDPKTYQWKQLQLVVDLYPWGAQYDEIKSVDYIILEKSAQSYDKKIRGEICYEGNWFWVIKNEDAKQLSIYE